MVKEFPVRMVREGSSLCSQKPAIGPTPEHAEFIPRASRFIYALVRQVDPSIKVVRTKLYMHFFIARVRATYPSHSIHNLITLTILVEKYSV